MTSDNGAVQRFVETYEDETTAICFAWNGKHEEQFEDANELFRDAVINLVISQPERAPLALLVGLYRALTEYSGEAWCIDERVEEIGKLMLIKGRADVAREYIIGARASFDAHSATSFTSCPRDIADECLGLARAKLKSEKSDDELAIWQTGEERFELLLKFSV